MNADALRESVELESQADLMAAVCNFGQASLLMRQANRIRRQQFDAHDPNELRELTYEAIAHNHSQSPSGVES